MLHFLFTLQRNGILLEACEKRKMGQEGSQYCGGDDISESKWGFRGGGGGGYATFEKFVVTWWKVGIVASDKKWGTILDGTDQTESIST